MHKIRAVHFTGTKLSRYPHLPQQGGGSSWERSRTFWWWAHSLRWGFHGTRVPQTWSPGFTTIYSPWGMGAIETYELLNWIYVEISKHRHMFVNEDWLRFNWEKFTIFKYLTGIWILSKYCLFPLIFWWSLSVVFVGLSNHRFDWSVDDCN